MAKKKKQKNPALRKEGLLPRQDYSWAAKSTVNSALNLESNIFGLLLFYHPKLFIIFICCVTKLALYLPLLSSSAGGRCIRTAWGQSKPWSIYLFSSSPWGWMGAGLRSLHWRWGGLKAVAPRRKEGRVEHMALGSELALGLVSVGSLLPFPRAFFLRTGLDLRKYMPQNFFCTKKWNVLKATYKMWSRDQAIERTLPGKAFLASAAALGVRLAPRLGSPMCCTGRSKQAAALHHLLQCWCTRGTRSYSKQAWIQGPEWRGERVLQWEASPWKTGNHPVLWS